MPFIQTKVNVEITPKIEEILKTELGEAIALIPGKSESWLMLSFEDNCRLYFKGKNDQPTAFVEVSLYGKASSDAYNKMTAAVTDILKQQLNIQPDHIYVKYEETSHWGWNGSNF